jgi:hypothetical protein
MKKVIVIAIIAVFLAGCGEQQKQKSFNIQDLKLGMQKYEVEKICNGSLEFIATEAIPDSNGYSKTTYRMWPNKASGLFEQIASRSAAGAALVRAGKDTKPYQLTFIVAPPFTKEQCEQVIEQEKLTDPNKILFVRVFEGYCFDKLIGVSQDMEMIKLQAIRQAQQQQNLQMQQMNQNLNHIQNQSNWQEMQNFQRQSQEDFYRMQRNR